MKKLFAVLLLVFGSFSAFAQAFEGEVTYEKKSYWSKIINKLTYLSEEERARSQTSWGNIDEGDESKGKLFVSATSSKYQDIEKEADGGYRWRQSEYTIMRDYEKGRKTEIEEFSGKTYVIEDTLVAPKWKVLNKIKEVNGYLCMLAVAEDTLKGQKITAWFANDLGTTAGPERYFGLPGLIMEVDINDGEVVINASKVEKKPITEEVNPPKKMKGKRLTTQAYEAMIASFIKDSIISRRNPYWFVRY